MPQDTITGPMHAGGWLQSSSYSLLFQTGYLTIKEAANGLFHLAPPNNEVLRFIANQSYEENLLPAWDLAKARSKLEQDDVKGFLEEFNNEFLSHISSETLKTEKYRERWFHSFLHLFCICVVGPTKVHASINVYHGTADLELIAPKSLFLMEIKTVLKEQVAKKAHDDAAAQLAKYAPAFRSRAAAARLKSYYYSLVYVVQDGKVSAQVVEHPTYS